MSTSPSRVSSELLGRRKRDSSPPQRTSRRAFAGSHRDRMWSDTLPFGFEHLEPLLLTLEASSPSVIAETPRRGRTKAITTSFVYVRFNKDGLSVKLTLEPRVEYLAGAMDANFIHRWLQRNSSESLRLTSPSKTGAALAKRTKWLHRLLPAQVCPRQLVGVHAGGPSAVVREWDPHWRVGTAAGALARLAVRPVHGSDYEVTSEEGTP